MKNKAKFLIVLLSLILASCLISCGKRADDHEHTYETVWSHDDTYHWYAATCEHTGKESDKALHAFTVKESSSEDCEEGEYTVYACECGYEYRAEEGTPREHIYIVRTVPATCTEDGYTLHKCAICGNEYRTDETDKLGHNLVTYDGKAPTCTEAGSSEYVVCTRCDYGTAAAAINATGHKFSATYWGYTDTYHWHPAICEHGDMRYGLADHDFSESFVCECGYEYEDTDSDKFTYANYAGGYIITGLAPDADDMTALNLPIAYDGKRVTAVKEDAFAGNDKITKVVVPSGYTSIGRNAFAGCSSLAKASLPDTVTSIGSYAFEKCAKLTEITMPESVTSFGDQIFNGCKLLAEIAVPDGVSDLGDNMFLGCAALESVTLPDSITTISNQAFARCASLESIEIPENVTYIGQGAFKGSGLTGIEIPNSVERIGAYAFRDCPSLKTAVLPSDGNYAYVYGDLFSGCASLESLTVTFVGSHKDASKAISVDFGHIFGTRVPEQSDKFYTAAQHSKTYYIPKSLKTVTVLGGTVSAGAFDGCSGLENIYVANSVTVSANTFDGCTAAVGKLS